MANYFLLGLAAISNVLAVYLAKVSHGMTRPWATLGVVTTILATQWLIATAMQNGIDVGIAVTSVVVVVIVGALATGLFFGERISALQLLGALMSIGGVALMNLASAKLP